MFAKTIIDSDAFLDMPHSTQLLYFHLSMRADDEGFINNPKSIMRNVGCKDDDIKLLIAKKFIIPFDSGIVVIKHWRIHNYIQKDRFIETKYKEEKAALSLDENKAYTTSTTPCIQNVSITDTQYSIGKVSIDKDSIDNIYSDSNESSAKRFVKPTVDDIKKYCEERKNNVDAQMFYDFYEAKGWKIGKNSMKDWKACVRTWERKKDNGRDRICGESQADKTDRAVYQQNFVIEANRYREITYDTELYGE